MLTIHVTCSVLPAWTDISTRGARHESEPMRSKIDPLRTCKVPFHGMQCELIMKTINSETALNMLLVNRCRYGVGGVGCHGRQGTGGVPAAG